MIPCNFSTNIKDIAGLQSNQIKKGLRNNQNNKIRLDKNIPNLVDKNNKKKLYNVVNLDKTNLDCLDKLNQHCNTSFVR